MYDAAQNTKKKIERQREGYMYDDAQKKKRKKVKKEQKQNAIGAPRAAVGFWV